MRRFLERVWKVILKYRSTLISLVIEISICITVILLQDVIAGV